MVNADLLATSASAVASLFLFLAYKLIKHYLERQCHLTLDTPSVSDAPPHVVSVGPAVPQFDAATSPFAEPSGASPSDHAQ